MASSAQARGIGRGLAAILPETAADAATASCVELPVDADQAEPDASRARNFDPEALAALAASIEASGVVQPLLVRPLPDGSYELVAGERRWRAAQQAGLEKVPAVVRDQAEAGAAAGGADREHGPRGPQPGRGGRAPAPPWSRTSA